jgi:hypothetical protein
MAQEALDRPTEAIESYRQAVAKGLQSSDVAARLAKLEQDVAADRPPTAVAESPAAATRQ